MDQKPSVGRIVHYGYYQPWRDVEGEKLVAVAAIVTQVNEDGTVNLAIFLPSGGLPTTASYVKQSETLEKDSWMWPPRAS